jgi:uncharacterized protein YfiM (DUF2279 family)
MFIFVSMKLNIKFITTLLSILCIQYSALSQKWLVPSDTLNQKRANIALIGTGTIYTTFSYGLYNTWYKKFETSPFHTFNDSREWQGMDKMGHIYMAYIQGDVCYSIARWTGLRENKSILTGALCGILFQSTLEMMDGFSAKWGFSWADMGANIAGTSLFSAQQYFWGQQRISLKMNSIPIQYSQTPFSPEIPNQNSSSLKERASSLYGKSYLERFLKDYNAQTYWLSINVRSFAPEWNQWPKWLNIALGYGAENLYGGFENSWNESIDTYRLSTNAFPRNRQFYIGFDLDPRYFGIKNPLLRSLSRSLSLFKMPSPALEINGQGQLTFHLFR